MIVYIFDKESKEFLYEYSPQKNPKNPDEFIYPKNSTTVKPEIIDGFIPVYENKKWTQVKDLRGFEVINTKTKEKSIVKNTGDLPENFVLYSEYILSDEYKEEQEKIKKESHKSEILHQIYEIDQKRIRAICEPEQKEEGLTWLEYYTNEIIELRKQLKELN